MKYIVYFELYGKKMRATVDAVSKADAEDLIRNKVIFHKTEAVGGDTNGQADGSDNDAVDRIMNIFGMKG